MEKANLVLTVIIGFCTLIGFAFVIYRSYSEPNKKQDEEIAVSSATCIEKHKTIDEKLEKIDRCLVLIQENDLKHIESRMTALELGQMRIETILNERLPQKYGK